MKTMKTSLYLLVPFLALGFAELQQYDVLEKAEFSESFGNLNSLKYLASLVLHHKVNLSTVVSQTKPIEENGVVKGFLTLTRRADDKNPRVEMSKDLVRDEFLQKATSDKLAAKVLRYTEGRRDTWYNKEDFLPDSLADEFLVEVENGRASFTWNDTNYISHYTFIAPGPKGDETTKIVFGDFDIQVVKRENFTDEEIKTAKKALADAFYAHTPRTFTKALVALLKKNLPGEKWQAVSKAGENNYLKAKKVLILKLVGRNYLIYSV